MANQTSIVPRFSTRAPNFGRCRYAGGRSSGVEHNLAKVGVESSNLFARSNFFQARSPYSHVFAAISRAKKMREKD